MPHARLSPLKLSLWLAPLVLALAMAMDVYVPAIPHMTSFFHVHDTVMLLTLNLFMLTAGIMQLVVGPVADCYGRSPVATAMSLLYCAGCGLCAVAPNGFWLVAFRVFQAVGSCGMMVVGFAMVRDCFVGDESAKVYSYLNGMTSFSPMFAPFIGGYLDMTLGWQATFLFLIAFGVWAIANVYFFLPETLPPSRREPLNLIEVGRHYREICQNKVFFVYTAVTCFGLSYLYLFCALSPYLIIRDLHISEAQYGFYFCYMGISFFIGSIGCSQAVGRIGIYRTCLLGLSITLLGGLWMACWYLCCGLTLHGFIYPMLLVGIGGTFCMGAGNGGAMIPFGEHTGAAAALGGALRFLFAAVAGTVVINNHVASTLPLGIPAVLFSLIGLALFRWPSLRSSLR